MMHRTPSHATWAVAVIGLTWMIPWVSAATLKPFFPNRFSVSGIQNISKNWCGIVKNASVSTVSATWKVPAVQLPDDGSRGSFEFYQWVGIDGADLSGPCHDVLFQGGTSQVIDGQGHVTTDFWYEFLPDEQYSQHVLDPPVKTGDYVRVTVTATSATEGIVSMENLTQNKSRSYDVTSSQPLCFNHVEWIAEDPGDELPFPDFDPFDFTSAYAIGLDGSSVNTTGAETWYISRPDAKCFAQIESVSDIHIYQH